jgi:hypothetical protein
VKSYNQKNQEIDETIFQEEEKSDYEGKKSKA